jgi:hypothetical protein
VALSLLLSKLGDTDASILDGYRFKFPALFLSIESENVWPSAMDTFC